MEPNVKDYFLAWFADGDGKTHALVDADSVQTIRYDPTRRAFALLRLSPDAQHVLLGYVDDLTAKPLPEAAGELRRAARLE